ncbi:BTB/POZ domain-containing protein [Aspergillus mulundensis]|uniref:BTB domain-containing protein n=1 Tax=Aspergillus mulundensis TaxID=1810919 RepID=A0A3D8T2X2_9EURO|nr:hypothetical protein DSM5745_00113 [Aspergillus mulundensis]RDW92791.1 hypothetical protein DSM5745_00113 [Aspergillus mulundensis]
MAIEKVRAPRHDRTKIQRLQGGTLTVVVGKETQTQTFLIHETPARKVSDFFDKALSGPWKESKERTVELPEVDPDVFALFVHWFYFKSLPVGHDDIGAEKDMEYMELAKTYVLGDMLVSSALKNAAIDAIVEKSLTPKADENTYYPSIEEIQYIYSNTVDGADIRRLMVDLYFEHGNDSWLKSKTDFPNAFLLALAEDCLEERRRDSEWIKPERYHASA